MMEQEQQLFVTVELAGGAAEEVADLARSLRRELLGLEIEAAAFAQGAALPAGAKAAGAIDWNTVILTLVGSGGLVSSLVMLLGAWVRRNPQTKLHLTLPNGGELKLEGDLRPGSELYEQALDVMRLTLTGAGAAQAVFDDDPALAALYGQMNERLDLRELRLVCLTLGVDFEQLGGETLGKSDRILRLIRQCQRQGRLEALWLACRQQNPAIEQPSGG